ncbi:uncharacterized [Tachysurus ichikawai]
MLNCRFEAFEVSEPLAQSLLLWFSLTRGFICEKHFTFCIQLEQLRLRVHVEVQMEGDGLTGGQWNGKRESRRVSERHENKRAFVRAETETSDSSLLRHAKPFFSSESGCALWELSRVPAERSDWLALSGRSAIGFQRLVRSDHYGVKLDSLRHLIGFVQATTPLAL